MNHLIKFLFLCGRCPGGSAAFLEKAQARGYSIEATLEEEVSHSYGKRGKPTKDATCRETVRYSIRHTVSERSPMACEFDLFKESTFILITSLLDEVKYPDAAILAEYKDQNSIEQAFRFLKSPVYLGPVFLKKPERVEALGYVFILVLLVAAYLEYRVRKFLEEKDEYLPQPGGQKSYHPTTKTILEVLDTVIVLSYEGRLILPDDTAPIILKMLDWIGFSPNIYMKKGITFFDMRNPSYYYKIISYFMKYVYNGVEREQYLYVSNKAPGRKECAGQQFPLSFKRRSIPL